MKCNNFLKVKCQSHISWTTSLANYNTDTFPSFECIIQVLQYENKTALDYIGCNINFHIFYHLLKSSKIKIVP